MPFLARTLSAAALALASLAPAPSAHGCHHRTPYLDRIRSEQPGLLTDYPGMVGIGSTGHPMSAAIGTVDCPEGFVTPAPDWHNGDTHSHMQWCGDGFTGFWVDAQFLFDTQIQPWNLEVSSPLIWGAYWDPILGESGQITEALFDSFVLDPVDGVSGVQHPFTVGLPETIMQMGIEASGFSVSRWGHVSALNIGASEADLYALRDDYVGLVGCEPLQDTAHPEAFDFVTFTNTVDCGGTRATDVGFKNDGTGDYPKPLLELFKSNPAALTGYAHQLWPTDEPGQPRGWIDPAGGGWNWQAPEYASLPTPIGPDLRCLEGPAGPAWPGNLNLAFPNNFEDLNQVYPVSMPMDVALGLVDYIEAWDMQINGLVDAGQEDTCLATMTPMLSPPCGDTVPHLTPASAWFGGYYKLLSAGQRVSIAAGSDSQCASQGCVPQTWVKLQAGQPFNYDNWTDNLKRGRVSLSAGSYQALDIKANGRPLGAHVGLESPNTGVNVELFYRVDPTTLVELTDPAQLTVEILLDGEVVHSVSMDSTELTNSGGNFYAKVTPFEALPLELAESSWISARLQDRSAHTGAIYAIVDGEPIVDCMAAEYWMLYCDYVNTKIDGYAWCADPAQVGSPGMPEFLEEHVGCSETEIREHIADARKIFKAVRDYDSPLPDGVARIGASTPQPQLQPMGIGTADVPAPGVNLEVTCFNAPPLANGFLILSAPLLGHLVIDPPLLLPELCGAALGVVSPIDFWLPATTNAGGYVETQIPIPAGALVAGDQIYAQYLWLPPALPCAQTGLASTSATLALTLQ